MHSISLHPSCSFSCKHHPRNHANCPVTFGSALKGLQPIGSKFKCLKLTMLDLRTTFETNYGKRPSKIIFQIIIKKYTSTDDSPECVLEALWCRRDVFADPHWVITGKPLISTSLKPATEGNKTQILKMKCHIKYGASVVLEILHQTRLQCSSGAKVNSVYPLPHTPTVHLKNKSFAT